MKHLDEAGVRTILLTTTIKNLSYHNNDNCLAFAQTAALSRRAESFPKPAPCWTSTASTTRKNLPSSSTRTSLFFLAVNRRSSKTSDPCLPSWTSGQPRTICHARYRTFCIELTTSWTSGRGWGTKMSGGIATVPLR